MCCIVKTSLKEWACSVFCFCFFSFLIFWPNRRTKLSAIQVPSDTAHSCISPTARSFTAGLWGGMLAHQVCPKSSLLLSSCSPAVKQKLTISSLNANLAGRILILGLGREPCHVLFVLKTGVLEKSSEIKRRWELCWLVSHPVGSG